MNAFSGAAKVALARGILRVVFEVFSMRARQIVFAARLKAGERGANLIDIEDFLLGLVLEDQGMLGESLFLKLYDGLGTPVNKTQSHIPFFPKEKADNLVTRIEALLPKTEPVGLSTEIALSSALQRAFGSAIGFQAQFRHDQIEPLHLLAGLLTEESSHCIRLLQEVGITQEKVLDQLRGATGNE